METFWIAARAFVNSTGPLALIFTMSSFRAPQRTVRRAFCALVLCGAAINCGFLYLFGQHMMMRLFALTVAVPSLLLLLFLTTDRLPQLLFSFFTAINALYLISIIARVMAGMREILWAEVTLRAALFLVVIHLFQRYFNHVYHFLVANMPSGWWVISVIPFLFFSITMFLGLYPTVRTDNFPAVIMLYGILLLVYVVIYRVFRSTYDLLMQRQTQQSLELQLNSQIQYYEALLQNEEAMRRIRHDMQGHMRVLSGLLSQGQYAEAASYLQEVTQYNDSLSAEIYCSDPYLNGVLSYFAQRFQENKTAFEYRFQLGSLDLPHVELCLILNNALENALEASLRLPEDQRSVTVQARVKQEQFLLRIRNRYDGVLPEEGKFPFTRKEDPGHGYGLSNIEMATQRLRGSSTYHTEENWFILDISVSLGGPSESGTEAPPA